MKTLKQVLTLLGFCIGVATLMPALAQENLEAPDVLVKRISQEVLEIAKNDPEIQAGNHRRVMEVVESRIFPHVNFQRMTSLAVGRFWREATPEQQKRLTEEFRTLLVYTYSGAIGQVKEQRLEFRPFRADPGDTEVEVRSQVLQARGQPIQLNYRLQKGPNGWMIYDVNVLGAWLVESYRNSFASEIGKNGIDGLIQTLAERNKRLAASASKRAKS
jgi:phospholipid transport system substrate-binding protein